MRVSVKDIKMTKREKALMALLIAEINGSNDMAEVRRTTAGWVSANDLHPEMVVSASDEELRGMLKGQARSRKDK